MRKSDILAAVLGSLAAFALLLGYGRAQERIPPIVPMVNPLVINDNPGGIVDTFAFFYGAIRASHVPVIVRGICVSACTLVLSLPKSQVCVEPTAVLGFHEASIDGVPNKAITAAMVRRYYPLAVQTWLANQKLTDEPIFVGADDIVQMGWFRACYVRR